MTPEEEEKLKKEQLQQAMFTVCETKEQLHAWVKFYLGLDLPDATVDPESTSNPMDFLWEMYTAALEGDREDFQRVLVYAARDSFKTLISSIIEVIALFHFRRSVAHMAAIESQAKKAQSYVKRYFKMPYLEPYKVTQNERRTEVAYYVHNETGYVYSPAQYAELDPAERLKCTAEEYYIQVVIATLSGANCIDPSSLITMADGSQKPALEVQPGDRVRSFHISKREWVETTVGSISWSRKPAMRVSFEGGGSVVVSEDHPIFTTSGWTRARALRTGMRCFSEGLNTPSSDASFEVAQEALGFAPIDEKLPVPAPLLDSRCVECGVPLERIDYSGFSRCEAHAALGNDPLFASKFARRVESLELVGIRHLMDIHIDTVDEQERNFIANGVSLLHNSEHVPFMCVGPDTPIIVRNSNKDSNRVRVKRKARGIFNRIAGVTASGRPSKNPEPLDVSEPAEKIEVLTVNLDTGVLEWKPILRGHRDLKETLKLTFSDGTSIVCTSDHPLYVWGKGFVQAGELSAGDKLLSLHKGQTSTGLKPLPPKVERGVELAPEQDTWEQVLLGSLLGDAGIYHGPKNNPYLAEQHSPAQADYLAWKREIISRKVRTIDLKNPTSGFTGEPLIGYRTGCSPALLPYANVRKTLEGLERLDRLGLAVWYMDDGCAGNGFRLSTESFTEEQNHQIAEFLQSKFGLDVKVSSYVREDKVYHYVFGGVEAKRRLVELCEPYIHPTMAYKFDLEKNKTTCQFCGGEVWFYESGNASETCEAPLCQRLRAGTFTTVTLESVEASDTREVYDFTIEGNHNFFTGSVLSKNCLDELDLADRAAVNEAKFIPAPGMRGELPITFLTSTRKFAFGLVQEEIDNAEETGLQIRHWNIIDVTQACPPQPVGRSKIAYRPDLPKVHLWTEKGNPKRIVTDEEANLLPQEERDKLDRHEAYGGCATCPLFAACKGRLATKQTSKSKLLKPISHVINTMRSVSVELAAAQFMCYKPTTEGLVYPRFDKGTHVLSPAEMAIKITGEAYPEDFTKEDLLDLMVAKGMEFHAGIDWGFTNRFAVVLGAKDGPRLYIVHVISAEQTELSDKLALCDQYIKHLDPVCWPDSSHPDHIKTFRRNGYRMRNFKKDVAEGIEAVRWRLAPGSNEEPAIYFLGGDSMVEYLAKRMETYSFKVDKRTEIVLDDLEDKDDDELDALRYLCQNVTPKGMRTLYTSKAAPATPLPAAAEEPAAQINEANRKLFQDKITELTGQAPPTAMVIGGASEQPKGAGRFFFKI